MKLKDLIYLSIKEVEKNISFFDNQPNFLYKKSELPLFSLKKSIERKNTADILVELNQNSNVYEIDIFNQKKEESLKISNNLYFDEINSEKTKKSSILQELYDLEQEVHKCTKCTLFKTRKNSVFGEGSIKSVRIMFIGEGPGENEDLLGRPFVGKAGNLLTDIIEKGMKIKREEVYITNIVKCRPPQNRNPEHIEIMSCINYLYEQIRLINPEVVVLLGAIALKTFFPKYASITKYRGQFFNFILDKDHQYPTLATYHPSYLLRYPEYKRETWIDIQTVMKKLEL